MNNDLDFNQLVDIYADRYMIIGPDESLQTDLWEFAHKFYNIGWTDQLWFLATHNQKEIREIIDGLKESIRGECFCQIFSNDWYEGRNDSDVLIAVWREKGR